MTQPLTDRKTKPAGRIGDFHVHLLPEDAQASVPTDLEEVKALTERNDLVVWLDSIDPPEAELERLGKVFGLSPLALEDAISPHERPKIDAYDNYWFLIVQGAAYGQTGIEFHEVAMFVCPRLVVSIRRSPALPLTEIEERLRAHPDRCRVGSGFVLYTFLDAIVDGYIPVAEEFLERVEDIEDRLFVAGTHLHESVLPEIFRRKKEAQIFRRAAVPMRDLLNQIVREDVDIFAEQEMPYFRDVYDHSIRVIDELDSARDLVSSALEIHLSVTANRQNEVSKQLTIIATVFLPLAFLTGFFGQNFGWLVNNITGEETFFWLGLGTEALAIAALVAFFKLRGWY